MKQLVLATRNRGKVKELERLLEGRGYELQSLADYPELPEIEETGLTFADNALLKAEAVADGLNRMALADDSGLEVPALDGEPGVRSARYSSEFASDEDNNRKLVQELSSRVGPPNDQLGEGHPPVFGPAEFVCCLVMKDPVQGVTVRYEGRCAGYILAEPRGSNGFGYDPYFYVPEFGRTMAELTMEEKNAISHRAKALKLLLEVL